MVDKKALVATTILVLLLGVGMFTTSKKALSPEEQCKKDFEAQNKYLETETYSTEYSFNKYPSFNEMLFVPKNVDPNSGVFAREFRTKINEALKTTPVNFDGRYSIVSVAMTGWGDNYFIVDRATGRAFEFPYHAIDLEFTKNSNLIVMNPKSKIQALRSALPEEACYFYNQQKMTDLRPFYFTWDNSELTLLGPTDIEPVVNTFWIDYMSDIPEGSPETLTAFVREMKERVIAKFHLVPKSEGYTGFALMETFPGLVPQDFEGIYTPYGDYRVANGKLTFFGNAPSNAAALDAKGWQRLLENLSKRLQTNVATLEDVQKIIEKISR